MLSAIRSLRRAALLLCFAAPLALSACTGDTLDEETSADALIDESDLDVQSDGDGADLDDPADDTSAATGATSGQDSSAPDNCTTPECRKLGGG